MRRCVVLAFVFVSGIAHASAVNTPAQVSAELDRQGAHDFYASLSDHDSDELVVRIGSGKSAWVALAPRLAQGSDAGNSEGLIIALATALPKNPKAVLAVINPVTADTNILGVERVCGVPFIEEIPRGYVSRAEHAVQGVKDAALLPIRDRCLAELRK